MTMKVKACITAIITLFLVGSCQTVLAREKVLPSACTILKKINLAEKIDFEPIYKGEGEPKHKSLKSGGDRYSSSCEVYAPGEKNSQIGLNIKQEIGTTLKRGKGFMQKYQKTAVPQNIESAFIDVASGAVYQNYGNGYEMLWVIYGKGNTDVGMATDKSKYGKDLLVEIAKEIDKKYY